MPQALPLTTKISPASSKETTFRTKVSQFGDGYSQRAADGLNSKIDKWLIVWPNLNSTDKDTVLTALDLVGGWDYLTWVPFQEAVTKRFVMTSSGYSIMFNAGHATISMHMVQVFDL